QDLGRHPLWEWNVVRNVTSGLCVFFMHLRDPLWRKSFSQPHQGGPQAPVHESDFSAYEAANQYVRRIIYRPQDSKYRATLWMRPPTSSDWTADDRLRQTW